ncbi:hypothetical protein ONZ45_g13424 [Pleurotus djamor]|nr:hypothetical protein ONZ45_g13424 [Pleurotus djamor]
MPPVLPSELWALVISLVASEFDNTDLLTLLTVSRDIHALAEPELFKNVYLLIGSIGDVIQSPLIQFHHCISPPNDYRRLLVKSFYVYFYMDEPYPREILALDHLIPTLTNLRSLTMIFARYIPSFHRHLRLFKEGIRGPFLEELEITATVAQTVLDITGLVKSQPSIRCMTLSDGVSIADDKKLLPLLKSLECFFEAPLTSLDGIVHLSTNFASYGFHPPASDTITTLSCMVYDAAPFHAFLPKVPNLRYLSINLNDGAYQDVF